MEKNSHHSQQIPAGNNRNLSDILGPVAKLFSEKTYERHGTMYYESEKSRDINI